MFYIVGWREYNFTVFFLSETFFVGLNTSSNCNMGQEEATYFEKDEAIVLEHCGWSNDVLFTANPSLFSHWI